MKIRGIKSFCKTNGIALLVLFGSSTKTKTGHANDLDIAVKFKQGKEVSKLKLIYKLDDLFNGNKIPCFSMKFITKESAFLNSRKIFS